MASEALAAARQGLEAWQRGDFDTLRAMMDPDVDLLAPDPGPWDCHGRNEVLALMKQRAEEGTNKTEIELIEADDDAIIATPQGAPPDSEGGEQMNATLILFRDRKAISMRQFGSSEEAMEAAQ